MDITKIIVIALVGVVAIVLLRQLQPELATVFSIAIGVICVTLILNELFDIVYVFYDLSEVAGVDKQSFSAVIKIIGIGYLTEFCNNICIDAGCKSIGDKILLAGKVSIMLVALPIITQLMNLVVSLLT
jgi:stage III sporulation protein AD